MRRFSSEGSLMELDFLELRKTVLKGAGKGIKKDSYTIYPQDDRHAKASKTAPVNQEHHGGNEKRGRLIKDLSISAENLVDMDKVSPRLLGACSLNESFRAYSDGQLAPAANGSMESMEKDRTQASSSSLPRSRARLMTAKLHLKSLFSQSPHSSNSNLYNPDQKDSAQERRSRMLFMRQWSQVGHTKRKKFRRAELEKWAESLNTLLASSTGVAVFAAFLRSEFSEENLQFYLACQQYQHSSNKFSLQRRAKAIRTTYIEPGSPREVNLDSKTRDLTLQLLQAPSHTSLNAAQKRIYFLLDTDCYPRFLQSPVYQSLLDEAD
ncbi:regulator of G-protein signaling 8 [Oryzias melastigma]|uniref:Si:ch211-152p11.4 n=1 Tax=Oryzias melastigma TaxID=30732 RepID=A0A3B3BNY5_ORYME|nr:regulator of G-protein signaling 8 [Oryzias melastigma]